MLLLLSNKGINDCYYGFLQQVRFKPRQHSPEQTEERQPAFKGVAIMGLFFTGTTKVVVAIVYLAVLLYMMTNEVRVWYKVK